MTTVKSWKHEAMKCNVISLCIHFHDFRNREAGLLVHIFLERFGGNFDKN